MDYNIFSGQEIIYSNQILSLLSFIPFLAMLNFKNILLILVNEKKEILNKATWIFVFRNFQFFDSFLFFK